MKHFYFSWAAVLFFISPASSQQSIKKTYQDTDEGISLRTSLTSFFDYDAGIMLGVNYRWSKHFSATVEPTWIFYNGLKNNEAGTIIPSGIKIRTDLRYHFPRKKKRNPDFFVGPEFHYKNTKTEKEAQFGINCQNGQCAYFQNAIYTDVKNEIGGFLKLGFLSPFPFIGSERWLLELYGGFGVKRLDFKETNLPAGGSFVNRPVRTPFGQPGSGFALPIIPMGLKLIFVL